jgi:hypothetical protein
MDAPCELGKLTNNGTAVLSTNVIFFERGLFLPGGEWPRGDKPDRLVCGVLDVRRYERKMMSFPAGRHDDMVDMLGLLGQLLDRMIGGYYSAIATSVKRDRWDAVFDAEREPNWKTL